MQKVDEIRVSYCLSTTIEQFRKNGVYTEFEQNVQGKNVRKNNLIKKRNPLFLKFLRQHLSIRSGIRLMNHFPVILMF